MRRTKLGPQKDKAVVRPRSSFGVGGRLSSGSTSRPKSSFGSSRRSSQYGRSNNQDSRPLQERSYQQRMIKEIIQFLSENDYPHPISVKVMTMPTSKEFLKVFTFLYSWLNPAYKSIILKKPDEEVPRILKSLGYPFTIHRTSLCNVGSPHTWPILLGALHWLMELVKFGFKVGENVLVQMFAANDGNDEFGDTDAYENKVYFEYLEKSYVAFLQGLELEDLGDYTNALLDEIKSKNSDTISEKEQLAQENIQVDEELKRLKNEPSQLEVLLEERESLKADRSKFDEYVTSLKKCVSKKAEALRELNEQIKESKLELEAAAAEKARLQKIIDNQEISAADVQRMKKEKEELKKTLAKYEEQRDRLDQQLWEKEMAYAKHREQTLALVDEYNERARKLKLTPSSAENAAGAEFELKVGQGRMTSDFKGTIKPNLLRFKQQIAEMCRLCQTEVLTLQEKNEQMQELIAEKREEINDYESKADVLQREYEWKKEMYEQHQKQLTGKSQELHEQLQKLRLEHQSMITEKQKELDDSKERYKRRSDEMDREKAQYEMFLQNVCEVVIDHKMQIQKRIQEMRKDADEYLQFSQSLPYPQSKLLAEEDISEEM